MLSCVSSAKVATSLDVKTRVARATSPTLSSDDDEDDAHDREVTLASRPTARTRTRADIKAAIKRLEDV